MHRTFRGLLGAAASFALISCNSFELSGAKLDEDPNIQTQALSPGQYFVAIHSAQALVQEGNVARTVCMWMQQCAGTDRQYNSYDIYSVSEDDNSPEWGFIFARGGIKDLRLMAELATKQASPRWVGISKIMEALSVGTAAGVWGDLPYSAALKNDGTPPVLDKQFAVYDALQTLLSAGITSAGTATGAAPGAQDLIYSGDMTAWRQAAWTLKARYHLATAEVRGATAYAAANAAAKQGISTPANDFTFYHGTAGSELNIWYQFMLIERDSYLRGSATLIDTMSNRGDPRVLDDCASGEEWCAAYFDSDVGSAPGEGNQSAAFLSASRYGGPNYDGDFRQPVVTWAETQLIIAETAFRAGNTAEALTALNAVRTATGRLPVATVTLREIAVEQWITMFQNIEVWNYWKRNCEPRLTPAPGRTAIPSRLLYPLVERNANPNIPEPSAQPARNQNDPNACP
ncbi:MAG: SusD/RagB family nutrient-binding outer membrane lipoprotein [Gemmatimonadaceae bacterium]|nr:SusD/RagB family nutrient-binding outer membrane lipoprotein [Gemmatimonadaceae bacterium]